MNVRIEGNCKKPTKQWPNNLYYECEFIAEHYLNTLVKFWNFSHRISRLRAIDCSSCDCVSRHDDCSRGWDFISGVWPFSNFFLNRYRKRTTVATLNKKGVAYRERRWPRWIKKASHIGSKRLWQSGRSPKIVALFSATNFSSYIIELPQLHDTIQIKCNYAWIHYNIAIKSHLMI